MAYFVVTGASSGIGEAMCEVLAREGHSLILVARRQSLLETLKERMEKYAGCQVVVMPDRKSVV